MLYLANVTSCTFFCFGWSIWFPRTPSKEIRQLSARTNMVLAEPPASKWVGFCGSFQPEKNWSAIPFSTANLCHIIISSSPINGNHVGHIHPYSISRAIGKSWMIMAGLVTKILSELCAFAGHHKELGRPQWHFHSPEIQQIVPSPFKKNTFLRGTSSFKVLVDKASQMIVPWNKTYFSWSLQALLAAKLRKERLRTQTNTSPWYRPWLQPRDSWNMSVLWVSKSFGRFRGQNYRRKTCKICPSSSRWKIKNRRSHHAVAPALRQARKGLVKTVTVVTCRDGVLWLLLRLSTFYISYTDYNIYIYDKYIYIYNIYI